MKIYSGTATSLPMGIWERLCAYRYEIFVEILGWDLDTPSGIEIDQFDRADTVYLVAVDEMGTVTGCARLLPTTGSYLLRDIFPSLLGKSQPPATPEVWELSRFSAAAGHGKSAAINPFRSDRRALKLMRATLLCASRLGARALITASPIGVERLLRQAGIADFQVGTSVNINGHSLVSCRIETSSLSSSDLHMGSCVRTRQLASA